MSEPALGSLQPCAQMSAPLAMRGRNFFFCASVPNSIKVGPSRKMPFWLTRSGAPAAQYSSSKISHSIRSQPRPPSSCGQVTMLQRPSCSLASQARCCSNPSSVSKLLSGFLGTCAASQARISARKRFCFSVYSNLIGCVLQAPGLSLARTWQTNLGRSLLVLEPGRAFLDEGAARFRRVLFSVGLKREALLPAVFGLEIPVLDPVQRLL